MKKFFVVIRNKELTMISRRHETLIDARMEAKRLCRKEDDQFIILQALAVVEPGEQPVHWSAAE